MIHTLRGRRRTRLRSGDVESRWIKPSGGWWDPEQPATHTHTITTETSWSRDANVKPHMIQTIDQTIPHWPRGIPDRRGAKKPRRGQPRGSGRCRATPPLAAVATMHASGCSWARPSCGDPPWPPRSSPFLWRPLRETTTHGGKWVWTLPTCYLCRIVDFENSFMGANFLIYFIYYSAL